MPINTIIFDEHIPIPFNRTLTHDDHRYWHQIVINISDMIARNPVQLHFEFYNELHHKPKRKKLKVEYVCPF